MLVLQFGCYKIKPRKYPILIWRKLLSPIETKLSMNCPIVKANHEQRHTFQVYFKMNVITIGNLSAEDGNDFGCPPVGGIMLESVVCG